MFFFSQLYLKNNNWTKYLFSVCAYIFSNIYDMLIYFSIKIYEWGKNTKTLTKILLGIIILFILAGIFGNGSSNNNAPAQTQATNNQKTAETQAVTPTITPEPTPSVTPDEKGSVKNPYGINEKVTLDTGGKSYDFSIVKVIRGSEANFIVKDANTFNEVPGDGLEYLLVNVKVAYTQGKEAEYIAYTDFILYSDNVEYNYQSTVLPKDYRVLNGGNVMPGGIKEGWLAYVIPIGKEAIIGFRPNVFSDYPSYISLGNK